jgi:hypothetical protein
MVQDHPHVMSLGTGVLAGWRQNVGNQLGTGPQPSAVVWLSRSNRNGHLRFLIKNWRRKSPLMASVETNGGYAPTNSDDPLTAAGRHLPDAVKSRCRPVATVRRRSLLRRSCLVMVSLHLIICALLPEKGCKTRRRSLGASPCKSRTFQPLRG